MLGQRNIFGMQGMPGMPGMPGMQRMQRLLNGQRSGFPGMQFGLNGGIPSPPGFQPLTRQLSNMLPQQLRNALPRTPFNAPAVAGVNNVLAGGRQGFTGRFGGATGDELTRQLSPAPASGGFAGAGTQTNGAATAGGATAQGLNRAQFGMPPFPGFNRAQGQPPNFNFQRPGGMPFGQRLPGGMPGQQQRGTPGQQQRGPRNQPQAVMPQNIGSIDMSSIQPGQNLGNRIQQTMTFPSQTARAQPAANQFPTAFNPQQGQTPDRQSQQTIGTQQAFRPPQMFGPGNQQNFGTSQNFGTPQNIGAPQNFGTPQNIGTPTNFGTPQTFGAPQTLRPAQSIGSQQPFAPQPANIANTGAIAQPTGVQPVAFPSQTITRPLGVGRPSSGVFIPPGAPSLLPGEVEIAPPISPADAAVMQSGSNGGPPTAVSEIITISDINGNILYRGVDLSDTDIEKITQQLVNNMTNEQAAAQANKGRELEAQGQLDSIVPPSGSTGQSQMTGGQQTPGSQPPQQPPSSGFTGQGFSSWGQPSQGLRFPGQGQVQVVGDSRTVLNLIDPPINKG